MRPLPCTALVLNKVDRPDARPAQVIDEIYQLFFDLEASESHIEFPIVSTIARQGKAVIGMGIGGARRPMTSFLCSTPLSNESRYLLEIVGGTGPGPGNQSRLLRLPRPSGHRPCD